MANRETKARRRVETKKQEEPQADVLVTGGGSVYLFHPLSDEAKAWVEEHVQLEGWQWLGGGFAVEHRYARDLAAGMQGDGLVVR